MFLTWLHFYGNPGAKGKQSTPDVLKVIQDYSRLFKIIQENNQHLQDYALGFHLQGCPSMDLVFVARAWTCLEGFPNASRSGVADVPLRLAQQRRQGWFKNQSNSIQQGMVSLFPSFSHRFHLSFKVF